MWIKTYLPNNKVAYIDADKLYGVGIDVKNDRNVCGYYRDDTFIIAKFDTPEEAAQYLKELIDKLNREKR